MAILRNCAALVSGTTFTTGELASGNTDIFANLDLKTLESHPGLASFVIGALMNSICNRNGDVKDRARFLLDEVAASASCAFWRPHAMPAANMVSAC